MLPFFTDLWLACCHRWHVSAFVRCECASTRDVSHAMLTCCHPFAPGARPLLDLCVHPCAEGRHANLLGIVPSRACHPFAPGAMPLHDLCVPSVLARGHATSRFVCVVLPRQGPCHFTICACHPFSPGAVQLLDLCVSSVPAKGYAIFDVSYQMHVYAGDV
jgi:hypothetical protein